MPIRKKCQNSNISKPVHLWSGHVQQVQYEIQSDQQLECTAGRLSPLYTYCTT